MELYLAHFKWRRMAVSNQVANKSSVLVELLCASSIRHAGGLNDGFVGAHVIDCANEPVVEDAKRLPENSVQTFGPWPIHFLCGRIHVSI